MDFSNIFRKLLNKPTRAYEPWRQQIPYQRLTEFHLYKADKLFQKHVDGSDSDSGYISPNELSAMCEDLKQYSYTHDALSFADVTS